MKKAVQIAKEAHLQNKTVVLVTGVFDILHGEHQKFLTKAARAGDVLLVGLECDQRVKQLKGEERPVNSIDVRIRQLEAWQIADDVFALPADFSKKEVRLDLIEKLRPTVLAVSSHSPNLIKKRQLMAKVGGVVRVVHQHNPQVSTTLLINSDKLNT